MDMAGLHSTYGYDRSETSKANEMLKTGQVPMVVNAMPRLVEDVSDVEDLEAEGGVNALQNGDMCYFCKKAGHQKRDCRKFEDEYSGKSAKVEGCKNLHFNRHLWGVSRNTDRRGEQGLYRFY